MSYYVAVHRNSDRRLALGPFNTHGAALAQVERVRWFVTERDRDGAWYSYGTARHPAGRPPGVLNTAMDYEGPGGIP